MYPGALEEHPIPETTQTLSLSSPSFSIALAMEAMMIP
jgi:hypothetical protein